MKAESCRCGHEGSDAPHPCHGKGYGCRKPAEARFYNPSLVALAGVQMKMQVEGTYACDECWAEFSQKLAEARAKGSTPTP